MLQECHQPTAQLPAQQTLIVLVCSTDENYAMPMTVMAYSALQNLKNKQQKLLLYVIDDGVRPATKRRVARSLDSDRIEINWIRPNRSLQDLALTRYLTTAAYNRLLLPDVLPQNLDKVIYLDCDMVICGDLGELWQVELGDRCVLAVQDDNQACVSMAVGLSNYRELGLKPEQPYFNSGTLVVNLRKWREAQIGEKVIQYSRQNRDYIRDADQDGLNAVIAGDWGQLPPVWNQMPRIYTYPSWQESPYSESEYIQLREQPFIIHYTNAPKPWRYGCQHPARDLFLNYLDQTDWAGWRDTIWRRGWRKAQKGAKKVGKMIRSLARHFGLLNQIQS